MFIPVERVQLHPAIEKNRHRHCLAWFVFRHFLFFTSVYESATEDAVAIVWVVVTPTVEALHTLLFPSPYICLPCFRKPRAGRPRLPIAASHLPLGYLGTMLIESSSQTR